MAGEMWVSAAGLATTAWTIDALANDVANVSTPGFKALLPQVASAAPGRAYPAGLAGGPQVQPEVLADGGVGPQRLLLDESQGALEPTGQPLDLAVQGAGWFAVRANGQTVYTRAGNFHPDATGTLVDPLGRALLGAKGQTLVLPADGSDPAVDAQGRLIVQVNGAPTVVGTVGLALVPDQQAMSGASGGAWTVTQASGPATLVAPGQQGAGTLAAGYLEGSNVSLDTVLPALLAAERAYQLNAEALNTSVQMWQQSDQVRA